MKALIRENLLRVKHQRYFVPPGVYNVSVEMGGAMQAGTVDLVNIDSGERFAVNETDYRVAKHNGLITEGG
jgi:hypothetical protein